MFHEINEYYYYIRSSPPNYKNEFTFQTNATKNHYDLVWFRLIRQFYYSHIIIRLLTFPVHQLKRRRHAGRAAQTSTHVRVETSPIQRRSNYEAERAQNVATSRKENPKPAQKRTLTPYT